MRVVNLCSTLRQGEPYARSFIAQVEALSQRGWRLGTVTLVCDGDRLVDPHLATYAQRCTSARVIFEAEAEAPSGSMARKAAQWASIGNQALQSALDSPCTHVLYVEADLCFPFDLVDQLLAREADIVAPLVFLG
ncbi:MAG: hypothetical protein KGJ24_15260, partial [Burkholderiales bacterium]|nr:hypothetical protein [Burkholderiales bacterium]